MLLGLSGQKIILLVFPWPLPKQLQLQSGSRGLKYAVMLWGMRKNDWIHTSGISCNQASQNLANYWICDEFQSFLPKIWATPLGALLKRNKGEGEKRFAAFLCAIVCIFGWFGVGSKCNSQILRWRGAELIKFESFRLNLEYLDLSLYFWSFCMIIDARIAIESYIRAIF